MRVSLYLSAFLYLFISLYLSPYLFIFLCLSLSYLSLCLSVFLSLSVYISLSLFISLCLSLFISLSISLYLSVFLSFSLCLSLSLSLSLSVCLSLYIITNQNMAVWCCQKQTRWKNSGLSLCCPTRCQEHKREKLTVHQTRRSHCIYQHSKWSTLHAWIRKEGGIG